MDRSKHPTYYYKIYRNLTYKKVAKNDLAKIKNDYKVLFVIKTMNRKNYGEYVYSNHEVFDRKLNPKELEIGNIKADRYYYEVGIVSHCATIRAKVEDENGDYESYEFHHSNHSLDGQGIYSIIKLLYFMKKLNEYGGWRGYYKHQEFQKKLVHKLYNNHQLNRSEIAELIEDDVNIVNKILRI